MKRFVTYLYLYDGRIKGNNAGFIKVEINGEKSAVDAAPIVKTGMHDMIQQKLKITISTSLFNALKNLLSMLKMPIMPSYILWCSLFCSLFFS